MSREYKQKKEDTPSSKAYSMSSHYKILLLIRFIQNIIQNIIQHPQPSCGEIRACALASPRCLDSQSLHQPTLGR